MKAVTKKRLVRAKIPKTAPPRAPDSGATPMAFWAGEFGAQYTERNKVDWAQRVPLLQRMIDQTGAKSFLDVGCNAGWNLLALRKIFNNDLLASGIDVNHRALEQAAAEGFDVVNCAAVDLSTMDDLQGADMVITSGVLIHIPPGELGEVMGAIVKATGRYVLCIEYEAAEEQMVEYRGHQNRLWRRPFGELYERLGMSVLETGVADGYDACRYWLLEKAV